MAFNGTRRRAKDMAKDALGSLHRASLKMGFVVLPNHYYTPVADSHELKRTRSAWARRSSMLGIDNDIEVQADSLRRLVAPFEPEYRGNRTYLEGSSKGFGPGFGYIEAQCLHGVVRALKPPRIVEVGSGISTYCSMRAAALNASEDGATSAITCIEPYPREFLAGAAEREEIALVPQPVQQVDPEFFRQLEAGDLLFIDSTHAVKPGGDVLFLYLEVIPRLKPGVFIHIHDICFPYLYQRDVLTTLFQSSETAVLQALLTGNPHLSILFCLSQLHYDAPRALAEVFPEYVGQPADEGLARAGVEGHFPSSIYLQTR